MQEVRMHKALLDTKPLAMAMFAMRIPHYFKKWNNDGTFKDAFYKMVRSDGFYDIFKKGYLGHGNAAPIRAQVVFKHLAFDA